ncbi:hypothetical protein GYMLUDRAFT_782188 [Collybiopsis luxurians FD-317 M1]|uniref:Uncharacterized protein n=1 Tax=Collybiopsis luxurians FD-317 M1 TaxID=944289 RepID=A0A0D0C2G0_9AGAR|nr:hypothetical protein GYMLUDRAFT_782188 [Collybiopsis luxurians FD-317 M1]
MGDSHRRAQPGPGPNSSPNTTRFWDKSQATYSSESWKENYRNPKEEMKKFLFGQPPDFEALAAPGALQDKRYKFAKRQGDETSSSSSDDSNEKRRRAAGRSRDVTPRASVVSLDSSAAGQPDPRPRSHLSQTHINYYHRGSEGDEHRHSSELDEGADVETRSEFSNYSNYSYEPGHDTSNSRRELHQSWGSNNQSYSSSYAASEEISISSGRHSGNSGSSQSQNRPSSGSRPSSGHISISSSRISSESGTHLSVSSLRYDGRSFDGSFQEARFPSNVGDTLDPLQRGSPALVPATAIHHDQHLQSPHPPPSDLIEQTSSNQGMLKAATEGFDSTYIFSGFKMSGNAMSPEDGEEPELDFIRKQADEGRLESQDDASSSDSDYSRSPGTLHPVHGTLSTDVANPTTFSFLVSLVFRARNLECLAPNST